MDVAIESVVEQLKSGLESLQKALEPVGQLDVLPDSQRDFYYQVEESLHRLRNASDQLEFQLEHTLDQQTQQVEAEARQSTAQFVELEAQLEAMQQQVRLLRGEHERHQTYQRERRIVWETARQTLKQTLQTAESRIAQLEAESLENRTWAIGLNVQRQVAQKTVEELRTAIGQRRSQLQEQTDTLSRQETVLAEQQALAESQTKLITDLKRDLTTAHRTIAALEQQVAQRNRQQLSVLQAKQESSVLHHQDQIRQDALEEQTRAYQSQIAVQTDELRQSQQTVQRWREQALAYQHQLHNICDWIEQFPDTDIPEALAELITAPIPTLFAHPQDSQSSPRASNFASTDVPTEVQADTQIEHDVPDDASEQETLEQETRERETLNLPQFPQ